MTVKRAFAAGLVFVLMLACSGKALCGPIHNAVRKGDQAKVIELLKQNPDLVSSRDSLGKTPLHIAAQHDQTAIAALLLANGADVNAQVQVARPFDFGGETHQGETPLTLALLSYHHKEMVELLVTHGADVNVMLNTVATPLLRAIEQNLPDDALLLLANGANPDRQHWNGQTMVHLAVQQGRSVILKMLLDYGADPNAKDDNGHTPMFYAPDNPHDRIVLLLRKYGGHR